MIEQIVRVENELGLHARAAAKLVKFTGQFESKIKFSRRNSNDEVDGKSILGILLLAAARGTELRVRVSGSDEAKAMEGIVLLFQDRFGEEK